MDKAKVDKKKKWIAGLRLEGKNKIGTLYGIPNGQKTKVEKSLLRLKKKKSWRIFIKFL
jgi:hypothetical protein